MVDIDVHFGNGTAELLRGDPRSFFASVHMIYGDDNDGNESKEHSSSSGKNGTKKDEKEANMGFYPSLLGTTEVTDNYVSVGVFPPHTVQKDRIYFGRYPAGYKKNVDLGSDMEFQRKELSNNEKNGKKEGPAVDEQTVKCESEEAVETENHRMDVVVETLDLCEGDVKDLSLPSTSSSTERDDITISQNIEHEMSQTSHDNGVSTARTFPDSTTSSAPLTSSFTDETAPTQSSSEIGDFRGVAGFRNALSDVIIPQVRTHIFISRLLCYRIVNLFPEIIFSSNYFFEELFIDFLFTRSLIN